MKVAPLAIAGVLMISVGSSAHAYDRFGGDIGATSAFTANVCDAICLGTPGCVAWTFAFGTSTCFLKGAVTPPSLNATCPSNAACVSGTMTAGWCGDSPTSQVASGVLGQGQVLSCPLGTSCQSKTLPGAPQVCWIPILWIPYPCRGPSVQTVDWFCL
jgi:hypothetical protein